MDVVPLRTADHPSAKTNFAGFDAIRALAALGVVLLHACVPYLQHPMPGLSWPVRDVASPLIDVLFWGIELFIMPVFLVIAGILAWKTLARRGAAELVKSRARRLLIPLLFGILVVLPIDLYVWVLGWVSEGLVAPIKLKSMKFDGGLDRDLWGLSHLWFLQYLFLYVAALAGALWLGKRFPIIARKSLTAKAAAGLLLLIAVVTLWLRPEVVWGFQHAFLPVPSKWIYSGTFFLGGLLLAKSDPQLTWLRSHGGRLIIPALLLLCFTIALGRWHLAGGESRTANLMLAAMTTISGWMITLCLIGIAIGKIRRVSVTMQYLGAASFWVYVVHHPFLGLIHTDLKWLLPTASPAIKTLSAFAICVGFCLLTYEGLVRKTGFGRWLGFAWTIPNHAGQGEDAQPSLRDRGDSLANPERRAA